MLHHQLMVVRQVRLALYTVDNQHLGFLARRRHQFDVCREACATQTYDAGVLNLFDDIFRLKRALVDKCLRAVDARQPLVAFHIDEDSRSRYTLTVQHVVNLDDLAAHRRMNGCAHEASRLGEQCSHLHLVTYSHHGLSRRTNVLRQQDNCLLGQRRLYDGLVCRVRLIVMRMNSADTKCILHNNLLIYNFTTLTPSAPINSGSLPLV